jgi:hypothetical protein
MAQPASSTVCGRRSVAMRSAMPAKKRSQCSLRW